MDLVGGHIEHFERAQLPDVWHEVLDLVRVQVQSYQQLRRTIIVTFCKLRTCRYK